MASPLSGIPQVLAVAMGRELALRNVKVLAISTASTSRRVLINGGHSRACLVDVTPGRHGLYEEEEEEDSEHDIGQSLARCARILFSSYGNSTVAKTASDIQESTVYRSIIVGLKTAWKDAAKPRTLPLKMTAQGFSSRQSSPKPERTSIVNHIVNHRPFRKQLSYLITNRRAAQRTAQLITLHAILQLALQPTQ